MTHRDIGPIGTWTCWDRAYKHMDMWGHGLWSYAMGLSPHRGLRSFLTAHTKQPTEKRAPGGVESGVPHPLQVLWVALQSRTHMYDQRQTETVSQTI